MNNTPICFDIPMIFKLCDLVSPISVFFKLPEFPGVGYDLHGIGKNFQAFNTVLVLQVPIIYKTRILIYPDERPYNSHLYSKNA